MCSNIAPYLIPGPNVICYPRSEPISHLAKMKMGSNPVDGKNLILAPEEVSRIIEAYPQSERFIKKYGGTNELVTGDFRYRSEEHTSELQSLMRISYAVFCLKKKKNKKITNNNSTKIIKQP